RLHGIDFRTLEAPLANAAVQAFDADSVKFSAAPVEGHQRTTLGGQWTSTTANLVAGALFVPIAQPKARLLMAMLEPQAPDSIAAWGGFNNSFERKEYMEAYVAEEQARLMLAKDPALKTEFEAKLKADPAFAKDPMARLDFFARRHPAWDKGYNRYPVLRSDASP
ncbi:MAG: peptidase M14, partial [Xanthomonadaceae bacterium]|nr:peptidase M14 [Xanthomonadaceae bacterium]